MPFTVSSTTPPNLDVLPFVPVGPSAIFPGVGAATGLGNIYYVCSANAVASASGGPSLGLNPQSPFNSINNALTKCASNNGDVIFVLPGHVETVNAAGALNFATGQCDGVTVIFLGNGAEKGVLNFVTSTAAQVTIGANNVTIIGMKVTGNIDALVAGINITGTDCTLINTFWLDNTSVSSLVQVISTVTRRTTISGYTYLEPGTIGSQKTEAIRINGGGNHRIQGLNIFGNFSTAIVNNITNATTVFYGNDWRILNTNLGGAPYALLAASTLLSNDYSPCSQQQNELTIISPSAKTLPQSTTATIFTFTGIIHVLEIGAIITTAFGATATTLAFGVNVNSLGNVALCVAGTVTSLGAGTVLVPQGGFGATLAVTATKGAIDVTQQGTASPATQFIAGALGVASIITAVTNASDTGAVQYFMRYRPLSQGVTVTTN